MRCIEQRDFSNHALMMQQGFRTKARHLGIRLSPLGRFYELCYHEAGPTARLLDLALTAHGRLRGRALWTYARHDLHALGREAICLDYYR
ncbi:MAG TPA: hypothetical protein VMH32_15895 [Burkholderiales bacterium]|nr:hypothetical protein [Burkholderiales bacterium]